MSRTLHLNDCLLTMGRDLAEQGRPQDALKVLKRLATFRDLPPAIAEETHGLLADLLLKAKNYKSARRHLTVAMIHQPSHARYYYLYATALVAEGRGAPDRVERYFRQALRLAPEQPRYWSDFGRWLVRVGRGEEGVTALRHAAELHPDDPVVLKRLVEGLCLDGRADEAKQALREARFRNPRDGRFRKLWNDFQYQQVSSGRRSVAAGDPVLLPFVKRSALPEYVAGPGRIIRLDVAAKSVPTDASAKRR